jgi:hypothetical protein
MRSVAAGGRPLDRGDAADIRVGVLAHLDLECAEALVEPALYFCFDLCRAGAAERREERQPRRALDAQGRMVLEHFDRGDERGRRDFARARVGGDHRLRGAGILADDSLRELAAKRPAAVARLAARAGRDMAFAPADPPVAIAHLDDDRLELGVRAVGEHVGPDQR